MCFPFHYCSLCESVTNPFNEYILQDPNDRPLYFCSAECRLKHFERCNRTIVAPSPLQRRKRDDGFSKTHKRSALATGRYADPSYYSI